MRTEEENHYMEQKIDRVVVDTSTGEILNREGDKVRIVRKESIEHLKSVTSMEGRQFYKGYVEELRLILPKLSQAEKSFLMSLSPNIIYYSCLLAFPNGHELNIGNMTQLSGYSKKTVIKLLQSLKEKDIVYRGTNSRNIQWYMNPWLFSKGHTSNKVLKSMFKNYYIQHKGCKWKDLGDF